MRVVLQPSPADSRRREILRAALDLFLEVGVAAATIEQLRDRSGASVGSIYHHFGSKEGVATALQLECLADYQEGFAGEVTRRRSAEAGIRAGVAHELTWSEDHPGRARYLAASPLSPAGEPIAAAAAELNETFAARIAGWVEPFVAAGEVRDLPLEELSAIWIGPARHLAGQWLSGRTERRPRAAARTLGDAAWDALRQFKT